MGPETFEDVLDQFRSVGMRVELTADGYFAIARNHVPLLHFRLSPPDLAWQERSLGVFIGATAFYHDALMLPPNRRPSSPDLPPDLLDQFEIAPYLTAAIAAGATVRETGGLRSRKYAVFHPAFGEFVQLTVSRGSSCVVAVTFADPEVYLALSYLPILEDILDTAAQAPGIGSAPPAPTPSRTTQNYPYDSAEQALPLLKALLAVDVLNEPGREYARQTLRFLEAVIGTLEDQGGSPEEVSTNIARALIPLVVAAMLMGTNHMVTREPLLKYTAQLAGSTARLFKLHVGSAESRKEAVLSLVGQLDEASKPWVQALASWGTRSPQPIDVVMRPLLEL